MDTLLIDPILAPLTLEQLRLVEDQLSNNLSASSEELQAHFTALRLTPEQAARALTYRSLYQNGLYLDGHTPILKGERAIRFEPRVLPLTFLR